MKPTVTQNQPRTNPLGAMALIGALLFAAIGCTDVMTLHPSEDPLLDNYVAQPDVQNDEEQLEQLKEKVGIIDYERLLGATAGTGSCQDTCAGKSTDCWCDMNCQLYGDCCDDLCDFCHFTEVCSPDHPDYETDSDARDDVPVAMPYTASGEVAQYEWAIYGPFEVHGGEAIRVHLVSNGGDVYDWAGLYITAGGIPSQDGYTAGPLQQHHTDGYATRWMENYYKSAEMVQYWVGVFGMNAGDPAPINPFTLEVCRDDDKDGICNDDDPCTDPDGDGICGPDACFGNDAYGDEDGDGICEDIDACLGNDALGDSDGDGSCDDRDLCIGDDRNGDLDGDGTCEELDGVCGGQDTDDLDGDGICNSDDICIFDYLWPPELAGNSPNNHDWDLDGRCNNGDQCPWDHYNDRDVDGACDVVDPCPLDNDDDADGDGLCANIDLCLGDNATGDSDGDTVCDDQDLCEGDDRYGDLDGDGICDAYSAPADLPPFYDQTGSPEHWAAGGTCVERAGIAGPPACPEATWQRETNDFQLIETEYPWTNAIFDAQYGGGQSFDPVPYDLLCSFPRSDIDLVGLFGDLNGIYRGTERWSSFYNYAIIDFAWGVNVWEALSMYDDRASRQGGACELDRLTGTPTGFHNEDQGAPWIYWTVHSTDQCDREGCRCDATVTGWTDDLGVWYEDILTNNSGPVGNPPTDCTDPRFNF